MLEGTMNFLRRMESRNPTIVRILEEKGSVIENRHFGIPSMKRKMRKYELSEPEFYEERDSFKVVFRNKVVDYSELQSDTQNNTLLQDVTTKVLDFCLEPRTAQEIREPIRISSKSYLANNIIKPLISNGLLDYTNKNTKLKIYYNKKISTWFSILMKPSLLFGWRKIEKKEELFSDNFKTSFSFFSFYLISVFICKKSRFFF